MTRYQALAVTTSYWSVGDNYIDKTIQAVEGKIQDGDFVIISEKAVATASGSIVNEAGVKPNRVARFLAGFWMRKIWGYPLGILCGFGQRLLGRLREYPQDWGSRHKQVALSQAGILQALMFGSEGGIDGSNLAYSYVSLPLKQAEDVAKKIQEQIRLRLSKNVCVIIADTDKTYIWRNLYFTPRPNPMRGIHSHGGIVAYVAGRMLRLKKSSTPLAVAGCSLSATEALTVTNIADKARGPGSGATVWDMAARFGVQVNAVSWQMLGEIRHKPIVIVRKEASGSRSKKKQIIV